MGDKRRDVVFVGRIEASKSPRRIPPKQSVGSYDWVATPTISAVEDEKVIAVIIKAIEIASSKQHLGQRPRPQAFIEYPVTQRLYCVDVRSRLSQPDLQRARSDVDDAVSGTRGSRFDRGRGFDRQDGLLDYRAGDHFGRPSRLLGYTRQCIARHVDIGRAGGACLRPHW